MPIVRLRMRTAAPRATSMGSGVLLEGSAMIVSSSCVVGALDSHKRPSPKIRRVKAHISVLQSTLIAAGWRRGLPEGQGFRSGREISGFPFENQPQITIYNNGIRDDSPRLLDAR